MYQAASCIKTKFKNHKKTSINKRKASVNTQAICLSEASLIAIVVKV